MKTIIALMIALLPSFAFSEEIKLTWDYQLSAIDGFRCYQKTAYANDNYDFDSPVKTKNFPTGDIPAEVTEITIDLEGEENAVLKYLFVCRAFKGNLESENSNEVSYKVVRTIPPAPVGLSGFYDNAAGSIHIEWEQPQDGHIVYKWAVYYRLEGQIEYSDLGIVNYGHDLILESPFDVVAEGEKKSVFFTVVAFRRSGVYSSNSEEYGIEIDRGFVGPIENLKIEVDIPLE